MVNSLTNPSLRRKLKMPAPNCGKIYSSRCRVAVVVAILLIIWYLTVYIWQISFSKMLQMPGTYFQENIYGIMFDAGSTGSRIHVFKFLRTRDGLLELSEEHFYQVKPGLSDYANNPEKGADSIKGLLKKSEEIIPKELWKVTPVSLKATAGLRMLPKNSSKKLLEEVERLFDDSPFFTPKQKAVSIMDGPDEGLFSWITVNFLLGGLGIGSSKVYGTLDLGGGSTQITLNPVTLVTLKDLPPGFTRHILLGNHQFTLYTHSYLGLGLMAARTSILKLGQTEKQSNGKEVKRSPCLHYSFSDHWKFGDQNFDIGGLSNYGFKSCVQHNQKFVMNSNVHRPDGVSSIDMYAFSYFYDRAVEMGLIDEQTGGTITVRDFSRGARKACSSESKSFPYLCLDATFIVTLFKEGYGFSDDRLLTLKKKIHDVEISWALGATLDLFDKMP
ncbi:ectonucleoside triphosphate diphosphohydrolase 5-like isoform X2 [Acropora millepora]|uniref:ectonucleoside triphosphate diphosphohydrolase 5-like isoform X2 n=1 Tax=Acropora millepora TaxID=45264 RepID=UPI001CF558BA|nr:ectonucleoside triphosphate diphosphohydrolase 5-like isoform X2 [Acropora millepora]